MDKGDITEEGGKAITSTITSAITSPEPLECRPATSDYPPPITTNPEFPPIYGPFPYKPDHLCCIIPCRKGSTRCPSKNSRPFSTTTLIRKKLEVLTNVPEIDSIIVSSDDELVLRIAKEFNVITHVR